MSAVLHMAGALLLAAACGGAGLYRAQRERRARRLLEDLLRLLDMFEEGILYQRSPTDKLWRQALAMHACFSVLELPENGEQAQWAQLLKNAPELEGVLSAEVRPAVCRWLAALGCSEAEAECGRIRALRALLLREAEKARERETQAARLYTTLGLCAGAAAVILLA